MKIKQRLTGMLFLLLSAGAVCAQSPGGVSSPELWFRTEAAGTNLNGSYRWVDYAGDKLRLNVYDSQGADSGEEYTTGTFRSYNGHPAISLDKLLDTKTREVMLKRTNLSQATIFGVFAPSVNFNSEMLLYGLNGRSGSGVWLSTDKIYPSRESGKPVFNYGETDGMDLMFSSNDSEADVNKFREKSMRIAAYYRSIPPGTGIWGERDRAVFSFGYYKSNNANNTSTFNIPSSANRQFTGYIPEFIAYNRLLNPLERSRVDSYLAVRYGLSLPVSYIGSNEQLLWDYAGNTDFNNRITAIYRDDASGLYQRESATSYEEGPDYSDSYDYYYSGNPNNRSSASRLLVIGRQYGNRLADGAYAFWGDDNASINLKEIEGVLGMKMMDRKWLLKTNIQNAPENERALGWEVQDLNFNTSGFVTGVSKDISGSAPATGYAYTQTPLQDNTGYIGLDYT
ncbi:MAG: T9SS C-terminal target domain-containing protein, partial [Prevotellaceae bacterium]|nr:T9SS C-terminal target domain-containing protein [Prevotellaceae bacterium]